MISNKNKIIFFHIPKTAGLSVGNYLGTYKEGQKTDHRTLYEVLPIGVVASRYFKKIDSYLVKKFIKNPFIGRKRFSLDLFESYTKVVVVRNPFARVVSWYKNVIRDQNHLRKHGGDPNITFN